MRSLFKTSFVFIFAISAVSCMDDSKPNYQFMPDMYESVAYETYGDYELFENGQQAKLPAPGSVPRGWSPYEYEDTNEDRVRAKEELSNPLPYTEDNLNQGRRVYTIYCAVCHGDAGDGQGILVQREKILGIPSYDDVGRAITEGSVYHVQYYGLNAMGSYAHQTSEKERWQITHYVMSLKDELEGKPERAFEDEGAADNASGNGNATAVTSNNGQEN